jgi:hypothetical protein
MVDEAERKVLDMVQHGDITAEEGLQLIKAMKATHPEVAPVVGLDPDGVKPEPEDILEPATPQLSAHELERMKRLKRWWILPFGVGMLITVLGAIWMFTGYSNSGFGWGFWLSWIPFLMGIFIVAVSFQSSRSVWLHVRVKQKPGERPQQISISFPLPITLSKWFLSSFGDRIPGLKDQPVGNIAEILENISPEEPFYVHVQDDDDGEEVEVFIG